MPTEGPTKVLITGFAPFVAAPVNPSWQAAKMVEAAPPPGLDVTAVEISCVFGTAIEELRKAVAEVDPFLVLCTGQAGGRPDLSVERIAINLNDAIDIPDSEGNEPMEEPVIPGAPAAYFASVPVKACVQAARDAGVPASLSRNINTFICNHLFYGLTHLIATERPHMRGGCVHVPYAPNQVTQQSLPSMSITDMATGFAAILSAAVL
ncbi:pyroglutamyl-peptidase I [Kitasatospora sp. NPDC059088]|uniref:pyroglutamyl-peptidase I n=1 Tax=Kitasatospora sp. NPDC059088 TaxID=3346722 RepID=UPI00369C45FA